MGKRTWIVGAFGVLLGFALGSSAAYFWLKSGTATDTGQGDEGLAVPEPSEQVAQTSFQALLTDAGVDAEVIQFRRKDWFLNTVRFEPVDVGGGKIELKPLAKPYKTYRVAYEADLKFRGDCQVKENFTLMWSPGNSVSGQGGAMLRNETVRFKKEERRPVQGLIDYKLYGNQWKLEADSKIDAGRKETVAQ